MNRRLLLAGLLSALAALSVAAPASATPLYDVKATWGPTNLPPDGVGQFTIQVRNIGDASAEKKLFISDQLPPGFEITDISWRDALDTKDFTSFCSGVETEILNCVVPAASTPKIAPPPGQKSTGSIINPDPSGYVLPIFIEVAAPASEGVGTNTATVTGGGSPTFFTDEDLVSVSATPAPFDILPGSFFADIFKGAYPGGATSRRAGDHPFEQRVVFDLTAESRVSPFDGTLETPSNGGLRTAEVTLPRGLVGNPDALPKCNPVQFAQVGVTGNATRCPANTEVGYLDINALSGEGNHGNGVQSFTPGASALLSRVPIYNLVPPKGTPVDLAFNAGGYVTGHIYAILDPAQNYAIRAISPNISTLATVLGAEVTLWGVPGDPAHDRFRYFSHDPANNPEQLGLGAAFEGPIEPFFTNPMDCGVDNGGHKIQVDSYQHPGEFSELQESSDPLNVTGCDDPRFRFEPKVSLAPTDRHAGAPTGLDVHLEVPQRDEHVDEARKLYAEEGNVKGISTPPIKRAVVTLPEGMALNPSAAQGLGSCTSAQIVNPQTGQITTTFDDLPQFPVSDMQMSFKGGVRAGLVEPSTCGRKTIHAEFFTWQDPQTPHPSDSSYDITQKPDGSPCPDSLGERPFKPTLDVGTLNNTGGSYSPFLMRLTRTDDDQEFSQLGVTLPPGLAAKFAGVGICPDPGIAQAISRTGAGDGALEQAQPSCPTSSLIGTTEVGAGVGVPLTYVPGKVYLAGPYRGAPISIVVITPAVVGPFDLGVIAVRSALNVNPETAQGSALTDPFPQIFQGIPVRIRDIRLNLDRPGFTLNPTSCAEKQIDAHITGTGGDVSTTADDTAADLFNRFQAADCASLGFKPKLAFRLFGGTRRGSHPKLKALVTYPKKGAYANIARASVALPHSEFLDQGHIKTVCTRVQFTAKACPAGSIYGHAVAKTPLFEAPLEGPVYLRSSSHQLPDLVAVLKGPASQPVEVDLDGRIDTVNGGIRNTFEVVPDAPVETFTLTMRGAKKGLLVNSTDLCASTNRATAKFSAQNGKTLTLHPTMKASCGKHVGKKNHRGG